MGKNTHHHQHIVMSQKKHKCPSCNQEKTLDAFVRKLGQYVGKRSKYQCIDCRVDTMYDDMMQDNPELRPSIQESSMIKKAFRWLFHEKV